MVRRQRGQSGRSALCQDVSSLDFASRGMDNEASCGMLRTLPNILAPCAPSVWRCRVILFGFRGGADLFAFVSLLF